MTTDLRWQGEALRALPSAVLVFDAEKRLAFANPATLRILGLPPETDLTGRSFEEMARLAAYRGLYGSGDPEAAMRTALSHVRDRMHRRAVRDAEGRRFDFTSTPLPEGGWLLVVSDISAHLQDEARAQERMRLTETVLQQSEAGYALFDAGLRLRLFNPAYERLSKLPPGTLRPGLAMTEVVALILAHQDMDLDSAAVFQRRLGLDRRQQHVSLRVRADGRAIRSVSQPLADGGFLVTLEDVTPMRQAEDDARRRAALLNGVLAALPHGICVYGADHRLSLANEAYREIMRGSGVRIGEHLLDICRRREAEGEYQGLETAEQVFRRMLDFRASAHARTRPDGTVISTRTAPLPDGGHISVVSDVTALHRAQTEAKQRADLLQAMVDSMRHGVCLFDREHRVVAANALAARMTGLTRDELAPGAPLDVLRRLQHERGEFGAGPQADRIFHHRCNAGVPRLDCYTRTRADGTVIEVSTDPTPEGGYVRIYTDVTEERRARVEMERARAAAEEANAAKSRFLATMSHELRTPLNAVIGFSEALAADPRGPHVAEFAGTILEAGRHLLSLIDEILEVAQAGTGRIAASNRALYLPSVLEGAVRLMRKVADAAGVSLVLEPLPALPRAMAEERRLRQILLNLLSNAVKFTPPGGAVRISAEALPDGAVELRVRDTGIGIEAGQLDRAFEPFVQLETSHARRYAGSGLGLYLARALAQAMGAELQLDSARGEGTVARLRLAPATQQQEQTA